MDQNNIYNYRNYRTPLHLSTIIIYIIISSYTLIRKLIISPNGWVEICVVCRCSGLLEIDSHMLDPLSTIARHHIYIYFILYLLHPRLEVYMFLAGSLSLSYCLHTAIQRRKPRGLIRYCSSVRLATVWDLVGRTDVFKTQSLLMFLWSPLLATWLEWSDMNTVLLSIDSSLRQQTSMW